MLNQVERGRNRRKVSHTWQPQELEKKKTCKINKSNPDPLHYNLHYLQVEYVIYHFHTYNKSATDDQLKHLSMAGLLV